MMNIAIIPARGGSKRIPGKNIKMFCGKPMIAWSIEAAIKSRLFGHIIVSTDDSDIAAIAREYGAETPFIRPDHISDDYAGTEKVISHAITYMNEHHVGFSAVCCIYATAPFIQQNDLVYGLEILETGNWDYVFPACEFSAPVFRSFQKNNEAGLEMFFPENYMKRSQDLPVALHDTGQFYWAYKETWLDEKEIFSKKSTVIVIPKWRTQDIDNLDDWKSAELLHQVLVEQEYK